MGKKIKQKNKNINKFLILSFIILFTISVFSYIYFVFSNKLKVASEIQSQVVDTVCNKGANISEEEYSNITTELYRKINKVDEFFKETSFFYENGECTFKMPRNFIEIFGLKMKKEYVESLSQFPIYSIRKEEMHIVFKYENDRWKIAEVFKIGKYDNYTQILKIK